MNEELKVNCKRCDKELIFTENQPLYQLMKKHLEKGLSTCCMQCGEYHQWEAENERYSKDYRCVNPLCIALNSSLKSVDGDEGYVVLCCKWCNQEFRVDIDNYSYDPTDDYCPTAEDDQKMVDQYHLAKYGEY